MIFISGAYSGPHERRLLHDLMDQYNKVNLTFVIIPITTMNIVIMVIMFSWSDRQ